MGTGVAKLFALFVGGGFALGFAIPAFVFSRVLRKYKARFDTLAAQIKDWDDASDR
jgi:hypothetical protein